MVCRRISDVYVQHRSRISVTPDSFDVGELFTVQVGTGHR